MKSTRRILLCNYSYMPASSCYIYSNTIILFNCILYTLECSKQMTVQMDKQQNMLSQKEKSDVSLVFYAQSD